MSTHLNNVKSGLETLPSASIPIHTTSKLLTANGNQRLKIRVNTLEICKPLHGALAIIVLQVVPRIQRLDQVIIAQAGEAICMQTEVENTTIAR